MAIHTETDTVVKRILPYLTRRGYDIAVDIDYETATKHPERYSKGYVDLLVTGGKKKLKNANPKSCQASHRLWHCSWGAVRYCHKWPKHTGIQHINRDGHSVE